MKKLLRAAVLGILVMGSAKFAQAANYGAIDLHFVLGSTMTVTIVGSTAAYFGPIALSSGAVALSSITVRNDSSSGTSLTYALRTFDYGTSWTAATRTTTAGAGADRFQISAMWNGVTRPAVTAFTSSHYVVAPPLMADYVNSSATYYAGSETGVAVAANAVRGLWLKIATPTSNTKVNPGNEVILLTNVMGIME
jgi:hypothetical protein